MKFGQVPDPTAVEYHLPVEPHANAARLDRYARDPRQQAMDVFIGATGWGMKEWVGKWYPPGAKPPDYLRHYGEQFNSIELNTTHYRIPDAATIAKWHASVPADFRYCPKLPQFISHARELGAGGDGLQRFVAAVDGLGEKHGCTFAQLPPHFGPDKLPVLEAFLARWPRLLPLAVEVRHPDWFDDPFATEALMDALAANGVAAVISDVAGRRDVLHGYVTAPRTMIRFVGNGLIDSDYSRLNGWIDKLREWNLPEVYFFPHEPENVLAPEAASWLAGRLLEEGVKTRGPRKLSLF